MSVFPNPSLIALQEYLDDEIYYRLSESKPKEEQEETE